VRATRQLGRAHPRLSIATAGVAPQAGQKAAAAGSAAPQAVHGGSGCTQQALDVAPTTPPRGPWLGAARTAGTRQLGHEASRATHASKQYAW
jgi:hypothetical protein